MNDHAQERVTTRPKVLSQKHSSNVLWLKLNFTIKTAHLQSLKRQKYQHLQEEALLKARGLLENWEDGPVLLTEDLYQRAAGERDAQELMNYTPEALALRFSLRNDPGVLDAVKELWNIEMPRDVLGCIDRRAYASIFRRIATSIDTDSSMKQHVNKTIEEDWKRDSKGEQSMSFANFFDSMFELADLWCETIDAEEYIYFLERVTNRISEKKKGKRVLRPMKRIKRIDEDSSDSSDFSSSEEEEDVEVTPPVVPVVSVTSVQPKAVPANRIVHHFFTAKSLGTTSKNLNNKSQQLLRIANPTATQRANSMTPSIKVPKQLTMSIQQQIQHQVSEPRQRRPSVFSVNFGDSGRLSFTSTDQEPAQLGQSTQQSESVTPLKLQFSYGDQADKYVTSRKPSIQRETAGPMVEGDSSSGLESYTSSMMSESETSIPGINDLTDATRRKSASMRSRVLTVSSAILKTPPSRIATATKSAILDAARNSSATRSLARFDFHDVVLELMHGQRQEKKKQVTSSVIDSTSSLANLSTIQEHHDSDPCNENVNGVGSTSDQTSTLSQQDSISSFYSRPLKQVVVLDVSTSKPPATVAIDRSHTLVDMISPPITTVATTQPRADTRQAVKAQRRELNSLNTLTKRTLTPMSPVKSHLQGKNTEPISDFTGSVTVTNYVSNSNSTGTTTQFPNSVQKLKEKSDSGFATSTINETVPLWFALPTKNPQVSSTKHQPYRLLDVTHQSTFRSTAPPQSEDLQVSPWGTSDSGDDVLFSQEWQSKIHEDHDLLANVKYNDDSHLYNVDQHLDTSLAGNKMDQGHELKVKSPGATPFIVTSLTGSGSSSILRSSGYRSKPSRLHGNLDSLRPSTSAPALPTIQDLHDRALPNPGHAHYVMLGMPLDCGANNDIALPVSPPKAGGVSPIIASRETKWSEQWISMQTEGSIKADLELVGEKFFATLNHDSVLASFSHASFSPKPHSCSCSRTTKCLGTCYEQSDERLIHTAPSSVSHKSPLYRVAKVGSEAETSAKNGEMLVHSNYNEDVTIIMNAKHEIILQPRNKVEDAIAHAKQQLPKRSEMMRRRYKYGFGKP